MKSFKTFTILLFLLAASLAGAQEVPAFVFHFVQYPGSTGTALYGVSNNNIGVGIYFDSNGVQHGFMVQNGKFTTIDNPNGTTYPIGVNSSGTIVGYYTFAIDTVAFAYANGVFTPVGPSGSDQVLAFGINDKGEISGEYFDLTTGQYEGWIGSISTCCRTVIDPQSASSTTVFDTNVHGIATVDWVDAKGNTEASLYNGTNYETVNVPGAANSNIHAIDGAGDAVYSWSDVSGNFHGAALIGRRFHKFDAPGCTGTFADGINDHHIIVGRCGTANNATEAFYVTY